MTEILKRPPESAHEPVDDNGYAGLTDEQMLAKTMVDADIAYFESLGFTHEESVSQVRRLGVTLSDDPEEIRKNAEQGRANEDAMRELNAMHADGVLSDETYQLLGSYIGHYAHTGDKQRITRLLARAVEIERLVQFGDAELIASFLSSLSSDT